MWWVHGSHKEAQAEPLERLDQLKCCQSQAAVVKTFYKCLSRIYSPYLPDVFFNMARASG